MSKKPKMGRPEVSDADYRGLFMSTRLTAEEYEEIERAIKASGESKTEWIRKKLLAAARRA